MPHSTRLLRKPPGIDPNDVWTPGNIVQMDAVVAACAMVAQAAGWVTPDERDRMLDRMRNSPTIAFFGADDALLMFEALNLRLERDLDDGEATAEVAIARLRGQPGPSRLLIETACSVAQADGGFDAEEREVIRRLCKILGLDPASCGLVPGDGDRR
ncbi:TerB family tellurite resistance protein [Brevundimonas sp.]|uniref:tellurite resistance TerB family protein n=1 Tax=Brevundimonas sp. TaxID=1871086 RepID=UPI002489A193|nr:TerB family tellurite resistance protein [Brevundimonas sp.]MDI1280700.1 TerB family tellurite resistance protein [Brevundimonas sp.]